MSLWGSPQPCLLRLLFVARGLCMCVCVCVCVCVCACVCVCIEIKVQCIGRHAWGGGRDLMVVRF